MSETHDAMTSASILRNHSKYQVSFTGAVPAKCRTPWQTKRVPKKTKRKPSPSRSVPRTPRDSGCDVMTSIERLESRRVSRRDRSRPWGEPCTAPHSSHEKLMLFYEKALPTYLDKSKVRFKTRRYVSNSKYGNIYEIRQEVRNKNSSTPIAQHWIWEDEYQLWHRERNINLRIDRLGTTSCPGMSSKSLLLRTTRPGLPTIKETSNKDRPSAELYAHYNYHRLERSRRRLAAIVIQKVFRGFYIRQFIQKLKRKVLLEHNMTWSTFVTMYRELLARVQARYGLMKASCPFDLKQIHIFLDRKLEIERAFKAVAVNSKLHKKDLMEFFNRADMWPTQSDINKAFDTVFSGSINTAEIVFIVDCSSHCDAIDFFDVIKFLKSFVISLDVAPDRVRVGAIPFSDDVINPFTILAYRSKLEVLKAISLLRCHGGQPKTGRALRRLKDVLKGSRPGVQQVAILITDRKSADPVSTRQEAGHCHQADISIFTVGLGPDSDENELRMIASEPEMSYRALDIHVLRDIQQNIMTKLCLAPVDMGQEHNTSRDPKMTLDHQDALDLVWTMRPPAACGLNQVLASRWVRPIINGKEAWSCLDENIVRATGMKACLRLVIQTKLERHGYIILPSDVKEGVEQVTTETAAMKLVENFLKQKDIELK